VSRHQTPASDRQGTGGRANARHPTNRRGIRLVIETPDTVPLDPAHREAAVAALSRLFAALLADKDFLAQIRPTTVQEAQSEAGTAPTARLPRPRESR
jgi:hypothetical protein